MAVAVAVDAGQEAPDLPEASHHGGRISGPTTAVCVCVTRLFTYYLEADCICIWEDRVWGGNGCHLHLRAVFLACMGVAHPGDMMRMLVVVDDG